MLSYILISDHHNLFSCLYKALTIICMALTMQGILLLLWGFPNLYLIGVIPCFAYFEPCGEALTLRGYVLTFFLTFGANLTST